MKLTQLILTCSPVVSLLIGSMPTLALAETLLAQSNNSSVKDYNHTIVIDSNNVSGATNYTIRTSGELKQVQGNLEGHQVTRQPNDNVTDNQVNGRVRNGKDGFRFKGEILEIELSNPNAAKVYVDGQRRSLNSSVKDYNHTIVIDSNNVSGATNYTIRTSGELKQVQGNLEGHQVTRQPNDNVTDNQVNGRVRNGKDGFRFKGEILEIELSNPNAAKVYVDGKPRTEIENENNSGSTADEIEDTVEDIF